MIADAGALPPRRVTTSGAPGSKQIIGDLGPFHALIIKLIEVLAAYLHRPLFGEDRQRAVHVSGVRVDREIDGPEHSAVEPERHNAGIFELHDSLVGIVVNRRERFLDVTHHPVKQVDEVTELGVYRSAVKGERALPCILVVIGVAVQKKLS